MANVQPHSGAQANFAVFLTLLKPGDTIMGMDLSHGGHLTDGSPGKVSGKWFKVVQYGVNRATERLDYDAIRDLALKERPKLIICGYSAYPRIIDNPTNCTAIADEIGSLFACRYRSYCRFGCYRSSPQPDSRLLMSLRQLPIKPSRTEGGLIMTRDAELAKRTKPSFLALKGLLHK